MSCSHVLTRHIFFIHYTACGTSLVRRAMPQLQLFFNDFPKETLVMNHWYVQNRFKMYSALQILHLCLCVRHFARHDATSGSTLSYKCTLVWKVFLILIVFVGDLLCTLDQDTLTGETSFAVVSLRLMRFQGSWEAVGKMLSVKNWRVWGERKTREQTHTHTHTHTHPHTHTHKHTYTHAHTTIWTFVLYANTYWCTCTLTLKSFCAYTQYIQIHDKHTYTHTHTVGSLVHISKTLTTLFTHLRLTVACYHDNASSHNSLYWLKRSLIFSSRSQWTSNDMLVFQPPRTTALVDYHPPNENMRQWYVGDMEREVCDQEVASLNPGKAGKMWLGIKHAKCSPVPQRLPLGQSRECVVSLDQWSLYSP